MAAKIELKLPQRKKLQVERGATPTLKMMMKQNKKPLILKMVHEADFFM